MGTGCNALHTELVPECKLPFQAGFLQQLLYVIVQMGQNGGTVLEVGSGKGSNAVFLAATFKQTNFWGLDLLKEHVDYANNYALVSKLSNVRFIKGDAALPMPLPIAALTFDLIYGIEALCHLDSDEQLVAFLESAYKILKPGGKIVVVDVYRSKSFESQPSDVQQAMNLAESGFRICRMASKDTWRTLGTSVGFKVIQDINLTPQAAGFWLLAWKVAQLLMLFPWLLKTYFS